MVYKVLHKNKRKKICLFSYRIWDRKYSLAIKISSYQPPELSKHLLSNSFTINSVAITFICYQASFAIRPQLLFTHLLSSLTCYRANLLSILSCNQQFYYQSSFAIKFSTCSQSLFLSFFFLKLRQKNWKNFSKFGILQFLQTLRGHGAGWFCCLKKRYQTFKRQQ